MEGRYGFVQHPVEITFEPFEDGTLVKLVEHGFDDTPSGLKDMLTRAAGWGEALTLMKFHVERSDDKCRPDHHLKGPHTARSTTSLAESSSIHRICVTRSLCPYQYSRSSPHSI